MMAPPRQPLHERIARYSLKQGECLIWTGAKDRGGYGLIEVRHKLQKAHRVSYELARGPIPDGCQLDHLCRNRACINPEHLEPVSARENVLRGFSPVGNNARKAECKNGHPLSGDNLIQRAKGWRGCRACSRIQNLASWHRRKAAKCMSPVSSR